MRAGKKRSRDHVHRRGRDVEAVAMEVSSEEPSSDEEETTQAQETAAERRLRLAREYVASLEGVEDQLGSEEDENSDSDAVGAVLAAEANERRFRGPLQDAATVFEETSSEYWREEGTVSFRRGHRSNVTCVCIADDGGRCWTGGQDGCILEWDLNSREKRLLASAGRLGDTEQGGAVSRAAKEGWGVAAGKSKKSKLLLRGTEGGHVGSILSIACSSDGRWVVSAGEDGTLRVWDTGSRECAHVLRGHRGPVTGVAMRWNSDDIYSCGQDGTLRIWQAGPGMYIDTLYGASVAMEGVDVRARKRCATAGGRERSMRLWNLSTSKQLVFRAPKLSDSTDAVTMLDDKHVLVGGHDGSIALFADDKRAPIALAQRAHGRPVSDLAPNYPILSLTTLRGTNVVASGSYDGWIRIWKVDPERKSVRKVAAIPCKGCINGLTFAPGGSHLHVARAREPRRGRWQTIPQVRDGLVTVQLPELVATLCKPAVQRKLQAIAREDEEDEDEEDDESDKE